MYLWKRVCLFQLQYALAGLILGSGCMAGGIALILKGGTGSTSWTAKCFGAEINVAGATPGVCLFMIAVLIVWITKPDFKQWNVRSNVNSRNGEL